MFTVDRFIEDCRAGMREAAPETAIREILRRAVSAPGEIAEALGAPREGGIAVPQMERP